MPTLNDTEKDPFNPQAFAAWMINFRAALRQAGLTQRQIDRYDADYRVDAVGYFMAGDNPDTAARAARRPA